MQDVKVNDDSVSFFEVDDNVAEIAPPFVDEHRVNVTPVIVWAIFTEVNANTAPFPDSSLMSVKAIVPLSVRYPAFTDIKGLLYVEEVALQLNIIPFKVSVPLDVTETSVYLELNLLVTCNVKLLNVSVPEL